MCSGEDFDMKSDCSSGDESNPEQYIVEKVVGKKCFKGEIYYRIKWKDYPDEDNTWEPQRNCAGASSLIREYEEREQKRSRSVAAIMEGKKLKTSNKDQDAAGRRKTDVSDASRRFNNLTIASENVTNRSFSKPESDEEYLPDNDYESSRKSRSKNATSGGRVKRKAAMIRPRYEVDSDTENQPERNVHRRDSPNDFDTTLTGQNKVNNTESSDMMDCTTASICHSKEKSMLRKYSASEIEIVGAVPTDNGVIIGIKAKNSDEVVRFNSKEVTRLWPELYVSFLETHIVFEEK